MDERYCKLMDFLRETLPESDLDIYPEELFGRFVDHALFLLDTDLRCRELEPEIFAHYVLCPRVNDEDLSFHRKIFYDALRPRLSGIGDAEGRILEVNRWCHEIATYQAQDERTASPLTVYRSGVGRCGEESAFLVSALRSVGIPARQVYVPRWAHCDDNHAWVEALCEGRWRFLGACEPEPELDRGWFNAAASRAVLVHSRIFGRGGSPLHGEPLGREGAVSWFNQTARYAKTGVYVLRALHGSAPAAGVVFRIQLLNEAGFHTVAALTAGDDGAAHVRLGAGDIHVLASWRGLVAEGDCGPEGVTLRLTPPESRDTGWTEWDIRAPEAGSPLPPLDTELRQLRARTLREGSKLRERRIASFRLSCPAAWEELILAARGNAGTVAAFLRRDGDPRREALLRSLSRKDLRDVTEEVLNDHLMNTPPAGELPEEIYEKYLLCPRIELEPLTSWRGGLSVAFGGDLTPPQLWRELRRRVDTGALRTYSNLVWTPLEALRAGRCDERSLKILIVACLRSRGIPARLGPPDGEPEYWRDGSFHTLGAERTASLRIAGEALAYRRDWTLSRREGVEWRILPLPENVTETPLPPGQYRLITTARLPNGSQFAARRELTLAPGESKTVKLYRRTFAIADTLLRQELPPIPAETLKGVREPDLRRRGVAAIICWIDPGSEPTEHLLSELTSAMPALRPLPVDLVLLPPARQALDSPSLSGLIASWPEIRVMLDDWDYDREQTARLMSLDPASLPLSLICDSWGFAVYASSGYRVGAGSELARTAAYVTGGGGGSGLSDKEPRTKEWAAEDGGPYGADERTRAVP